MFSILHRSSIFYFNGLTIPSSRPFRIGELNSISKVFHHTRSIKTMANLSGSPNGTQIPQELYKMVKDKVQKRRAERELLRSKKYILKSAHLQVLGGTDDGKKVPSLIVHSEGIAHIFNCAAGLPRLANADSIKLIDIENIFLTNDSWSNIDGFVSMVLTLQELGALSLTIHGTSSVSSIYQASFSFLQLFSGIECTTKDQFSGDFVDKGLHVHKIPIEPNTQDNENEPLSKRFKDASRLVAYSCTLPDLPGTLDPIKCRDLGVPFGPLLGKLKAGLDVELPNGNVIKHSQVLGPEQIGDRFLVIECPTKNFIQHVIRNQELVELRKGTERPLSVVVHFSPEDVTNAPAYQDWMQGFPKDCKHWLLNHSSAPTLELTKSHRLQYLLNKMNSTLFPMLIRDESTLDKIRNELETEPDEKAYLLENDAKNHEFVGFDDLGNVIKARSTDRLMLKPKRYFEIAKNPIYINAMYNESLDEPDFLPSLAAYNKLKDELPQPKDYEPELVFLGTSSSRPHTYRNTSGILLNFRSLQKAVIMDCSEDTYGQLYRLYGQQKSDEILANLKMIYVSHQHADHHAGLLTILKHRRALTNGKVILVLPPSIEQFINFYNKNYEDLSSSYTVFGTRTMRTKPLFGSAPLSVSEGVKKELYKSLNGFLDDIQVTGVHHCFNACAVVMRFKIGHPEMDTYTVAFSGDCRPSKDLIEMGKNCDLLIHEATFDHVQIKEAISKRHSTTDEAIDMGRKMNAKFTMLTHFSNRLARVPLLTEDFDEKVGVAFDNMIVKCPSQLMHLSHMTPLMRVAFRRFTDQLEFTYSKRKINLAIASDLMK